MANLESKLRFYESSFIFLKKPLAFCMVYGRGSSTPDKQCRTQSVNDEPGKFWISYFLSISLGNKLKLLTIYNFSAFGKSNAFT